MEENTAIQLLQLEGEVVVDSRIVAKGIGIEHESLMKTIYTYQVELQEFGLIRFEIGVKSGPQRGKLPQYALLNRNQIGVVTSLSRNTPQVVRFKVDLFKAIDAMEQQFIQATSPIYQLPPPVFKNFSDVFLAEPLCPTPTREQVENAIIRTVQWLEPYRELGVTVIGDLMMYNAEIQSYRKYYGLTQPEIGLSAVIASLVERSLLIRTKVDEVSFYKTIPTSGLLE